MKKNINYKAVFVSGEDKETIKYHIQGEYEEGIKTLIRFKNENMNIEIVYKGSDIWLKNNHSLLHLNTDIDIENDYQTMYGNIKLNTKVISFKANESSIKLNYQLYDRELISSVYILITMSDVLAC